jgi:hypothetical protein
MGGNDHGTIRDIIPSVCLEENHENLGKDSRYPGRDSNQTIPKYKPCMLPSPICQFTLWMYFINGSKV